MADTFRDARGLIRDLLTEPLDAVTYILTRAGAVRGNHIHRETVQWAYVMTGRMLFVRELPDGRQLSETYGPGGLVVEPPGTAHAWKALEDTEVLVFTRGPRSGEGYESDVVRLEVPLL